jgi:hypothetical protein
MKEMKEMKEMKGPMVLPAMQVYTILTCYAGTERMR